MPKQTSLTDDIWTPSTPTMNRDSIINHPATDKVDAENMAFITPEDGLKFPHPDEIVKLTDDKPIESTTDMSATEEADPENGVFLAMDAEEVYKFLETMQKKTDWWLKNKKEDLLRQTPSQRSVKMSNPDKQWIVDWEQKRRAEEQGEWNPTSDSKGWQSLPRAEG